MVSPPGRSSWIFSSGHLWHLYVSIHWSSSYCQLLGEPLLDLTCPLGVLLTGSSRNFQLLIKQWRFELSHQRSACVPMSRFDVKAPGLCRPSCHQAVMILPVSPWRAGWLFICVTHSCKFFTTSSRQHSQQSAKDLSLKGASTKALAFQPRKKTTSDSSLAHYISLNRTEHVPSRLFHCCNFSARTRWEASG